MPDSQPIVEPYLMICHIPVHVTPDGRRWLDGLWYKDLLQHVVYIDDFTIACPRANVAEATPGYVLVEDPRVKFVDLPGRHKLTLRLPETWMKLSGAVGRAKVVHTGVGGWLPISIGNVSTLLAKIRKRMLVVIVESATWRIVPGSRPSLGARAKAALAEAMNRWCISQANVAIFTQAQYKQSLMVDRPERGHIIHASWIDEDIICSDAEADRTWTAKSEPGGRPLKLLFAGRMTSAKGVLVLLEAMRRMERDPAQVELDVIGEGELLDDCRRFAASATGPVRLRVLDPVAYGEPFFRLLRDYHAVVVPSVSDEQPRIVYDAYSQAVPVLASATDGLRDCVAVPDAGRLFAPNDPEALKDTLTWASQNLPTLRAMGMAGLARAHAMTHREMHRVRQDLLLQYLAAGN